MTGRHPPWSQGTFRTSAKTTSREQAEGISRQYEVAAAGGKDMEAAMSLLWSATSEGLKRFDGHQWSSVGSAWNLPEGCAKSMYVDSLGTIWVSSNYALAFLPQGEKRFHETNLRYDDYLVAMSAEQDGTLWTSGIRGKVLPFRLEQGRLESAGQQIDLKSVCILVDREGVLWVATTDQGVRLFRPRNRLAFGMKDTPTIWGSFQRGDGLTGEEGLDILEDAEGSIHNSLLGTIDSASSRATMMACGIQPEQPSIFIFLPLSFRVGCSRHSRSLSLFRSCSFFIELDSTKWPITYANGFMSVSRNENESRETCTTRSCKEFRAFSYDSIPEQIC